MIGANLMPEYQSNMKVFAEITSKENDLTSVKINISGDKLIFHTSVDTATNKTDYEPFLIFKNTTSQIIAIGEDIYDSVNSVDVFILNKTSGIALWSRTAICGKDDLCSYTFGNNPYTNSEYLVCR